jgi:hypothetical protein
MTLLGRNWCSWEENIIFSLKEIGRNVVDRINSAMDRDNWHALVDMSQDIRFHKTQEISWLSEELLAFQKLCYMQYAS